MTDPIKPKHGKAYDPNAQGGGDGTPDPDKGKDLSYLVPTVAIGKNWSTPASFNDDPPGGSSKSDNKPTPSVDSITVDLGSIRSAETTMLGAARTAITDYSTLRDKVMAVKDTVFGQTAVETVKSRANSDGVNSPYDHTQNSPVQDPAKKFAEEINPAQEKALWQMANALEIVGQYIAALNAAGQSYAKTDRASNMPPPPAS